MTAAEKAAQAELIAAKEQVISAHQQTILVMSDQIDHLRTLLAQKPEVQGFERIEAAPVDTTPPGWEPQRWHTSEEEDDIESMRAIGALTDEAAEAALQVIGARGPTHIVR